MRRKDRGHTGNLYLDPKAFRLAQRCRMGDITAMGDMAQLLRRRCSRTLQTLLGRYEAEPTPFLVEQLEEHFTRNFSEECNAQGYMFWLLRAALYGDPHAEVQVERLPYYKTRASLPYTLLTGEDSAGHRIWASDFLWRIGLPDVKRGLEDCVVFFHRAQGCFELCYAGGYVPPDQGLEWDYSSLYFDEFFCRLPTDKKRNITAARKLLEAERALFWKNPLHHAQQRKYRERMSQ